MAKSKESKATKGRVCGVCIAGLVSGMASGKILGKKRGRSGGAIYRAEFDRPRGKAPRFWLSPQGYDTLVKLEGQALTQEQIREAMVRWNVGARVYERSSGKLLWSMVLAKDGTVTVDTDWEKVRNEQRESALRGPPAHRLRGRSGGARREAEAIADAIFDQLGGGRLQQATGVRRMPFSWDGPGHGSLQLKIPRPKEAVERQASKGPRDLAVFTLTQTTPKPLYTVRFYGLVPDFRQYVVAKLFEGVRFEDLRKVFSAETGFDLPPPYRPSGRSVGVFLGAAAALAALAAYTLSMPKVDRPPHGDGPGYYVFLFDKQWDGPYPTQTAAEDRADEAFDFWNRPGGGARGMARPTVRYLERAPSSESKGNVSGRSRKARKGRSGASVANVIFEQLGGNRFASMTGAKYFLSSDEPGLGTLQFKLPKSGARAKLGIDAVRVTLEEDDTYTMRFYKGMAEVRVIGGLYADTLRQAFTSVTGLETSLGTFGRCGAKAGRVGGKEPEELKTWGVFPWTPDSSPSAGAPVPDAAHGGYVVREANRETGKGTHWPYSQVQAVKLYWRRHLADRHSSELTYGKGKKK